MGLSFAWTAVNGLPATDALSRLSLGPTEESCDFPFNAVASHVLPNHWFMVAAGSCNHRIINSESMAALSAGCQAVAFAIEEHVGFSMAELWIDGEPVWNVEYSADRPKPMCWSGTLPGRFETLHASAEPEDSENMEGFFLMDIPVLMAEDITGYRHDENNPG